MPAQPQKHTDYSGTPLPKKLGIVSSSVKPAPTEVCLLAAPADFQRSLGELPSHVTFTQRLTPRTTLALCFIRSLPDLDATIDILLAKLPKTASAWIIRPKTHLKPGFNENHIRDAALAHGLVDYKICAVDDNWSGIKFAWRKAST